MVTGISCFLLPIPHYVIELGIFQKMNEVDNEAKCEKNGKTFYIKYRL